MLGLCVTTLLVLFAGYHVYGVAVENDNNIVYFSDRLANVIKNHCLKNADGTKYQAALEGLHDFKSCWKLTVPRKKLFGEEFYKYCIKHSEVFITCLVKFVDELIPCLGPEENYLKSFIIDSYGDYSHYFCKMLFLREATKGTSCSEVFTKHPEIDPLVACYKNSTVFGDESMVDVITKSELCGDILNIRRCNSDIFAEHCPDDPEYLGLRNELLAHGLINCLDVLDDETKERINDGHVHNAVVKNPSDIVYFYARLANIIKKHCLKNADEAKYEEALEGLHEFRSCWQLALPEKQFTGEKLYNYCIKRSEEFTKCLDTLVEQLTPCLGPEENYLKSFIVDSYGDYNHYFCKYLELSSVSETTKRSSEECIMKLTNIPDMEELHRVLMTQKLTHCLDALDKETKDTTNNQKYTNI